ncbi:MAG: hypothetical protein IKW60_00545 [Clostridia bacterium]|nr:hypothetical protein [Clostridia bacterium]
MVDFHTHILPEMDDGSRSVEQSLKMLELMRNYGVDTVMATPHFDLRLESIESFLARRDAAMAKLNEAIGGTFTIIPGAEVLYCGLSLHQIDGIEKLCIGKSRYLLIEPSMEQLTVSYYNDMVRLMSECNITPVLAHIERYYYIGKNREWIHRLRKEGAVLQMNAEAFSGWKKGKAIKLMRNESVQIFGSDCHNLERRSPNLSIVMKYMSKRYVKELDEHLATWETRILNEC